MDFARARSSWTEIGWASDMSEVQWLTTAPNPRVASHSADFGQRGWRTHAVLADTQQSVASLGHRAALCGLRPVHGWDMDLFIEKKCARCLAVIARRAATSG